MPPFGALHIPGSYRFAPPPPPPPSLNGLDPHSRLHEVLQDPRHHSPRNFTLEARVTIYRQLFGTIWHREEWMAMFSEQEVERLPGQTRLTEWLDPDIADGDQMWRLSQHQKRAEERRSAEVKEPRKGKVCAKVLQRNERSYSCR